MLIEINYRDMGPSDAVEAHIRHELEATIGRFSDRITRIEVHVGDENGHKSGPDDKRCMFEARPAGLDPIVVEEHTDDLYTSISSAAGKLSRALTRRFEKMEA